ncbi:flagellar basal body-associated protein FliL [Leadbettera azotonutricia ZAS-9]|uniref:Flagellar basal body-associated protein FliL n=1 Tax=Leadbettera azotonutricia (strain ATCC BAA-888 / DSM 13862 / ZAS-9) TaxID=545695 RepID=F5YDD0_LEAAZ|nr:flagellar basal body-associated protein FliL [Leadbettera azotonutricia ZAS-9]
MLIIYRSLIVLALIILLVIIAGVVWALFLKPQDNAKPAQTSSRVSPVESGNTFTGIGRLRLPLGDNQPATAIVSITFPYNPGDKAFSEELASRVGEFRALTSAYFKSRTASQLEKVDEEEIKKALLDQYNGVLRLGKIEILYFNDYMIID